MRTAPVAGYAVREEHAVTLPVSASLFELAEREAGIVPGLGTAKMVETLEAAV